MVNILVPTDFSALSRIAIRYAVMIANELKGNVTLVHVLTVIQPPRASVQLKIKSLEEELEQLAEEDMKQLVREMQKLNKTRTPIRYRIEKGQNLPDTVRAVARNAHSGLIVMGTRGASGLKKYVMGTNATSIIEISHIPVMVIPEKASYKGFANVVFPTSLRVLGKELKSMLPYFKIFGSTIHLVHVVESAKDVAAGSQRLKGLLKGVSYKKVVVKVLVGKNVEEALDAYVRKAKGDLITMFTHKHSFYERLFNRSITRKIAFQSSKPLLAFPWQE